MFRITDCPVMTSGVYHGLKATDQTKKRNLVGHNVNLYGPFEPVFMFPLHFAVIPALLYMEPKHLSRDMRKPAFAYAKTTAQISCTVTMHLITALALLHGWYNASTC